MSRAHALAVCSAFLATLLCARAEAFRLPTNFNQSAAIGGSGGRYFTGSPSDRYTCKVCHTSIGHPPIQVTGLPFGGYTPGQTYTILIDWPDNLPSVAFNLEMTDGAGKALGTFSTPAMEELPPGEVCMGRPGTVVAPPERTLAFMTECGAQQSTIRWTAPMPVPDASGRLVAPEAWFSGSLLSSNKDQSVEGDAVMDLSNVFGPLGQATPVATRIDGNCSVTGAGPRSSHGFVYVMSLISLLTGAWWLRRGRRRVS